MRCRRFVSKECALGALRTFDTAPRFSNELFVTSGMPDSVISALEEILLRS